MAKLKRKIATAATGIKKGAKLLGGAGKAFARNMAGAELKGITGAKRKK